jgi:hypothetical protein
MATTDNSETTTMKRIESLFSAEVYGASVARALDALAALEACVRADLLRGPAPPETVPFVRPQQGTLYEADTLTWRFYHTNAGCVVHAIGNKAYGTALARALCEDNVGRREDRRRRRNLL